MSKKISLTGVKPTGMPHLGNYLGAMRPALQMAKSGKYDCFYFIADYHTLTSLHDAKLFKEYVYEVTACWLAAGLDPNEVTIYRQSDIPEILELNWVLSCFTAKGLMNRAHAYKAIVQDNNENKRDQDQGVNMGLYTYPILMACDILMMNADVVPVGSDNLQHIEIARDIVNVFNHTYKTDILKLPEAIAREDKLTKGLDGRKMSKSYNNHIPLFSTEKKLKKLINKITTDTSPPETPKDPEESMIFEIYKDFANTQQIDELAAWYKKGIGWGEAKAELFKVVNAELAGPREHYEKIMQNKSEMDEILSAGKDKVRARAQNLLNEVKETVGVK